MKRAITISSLLPCLFVTSLFFGCSKSNNNNTTKSKTELLQGSWHHTSVIYSPAMYDYNNDGVKDAEAYPFTADCQKDDFMTLQTNGVAVFDEGTTKCNPSDPQTRNTTWSLSSDEKTLTVDGASVTLIQLDDNVLKVLTTGSDNGVSFTITVTYQRK